jgi:plastocyanin
MNVPFYARVAIISILILAAAFLAVGLLLAAQGSTASAAFVAPFVVVSLVLAELARRFGRAMLLLLAVWAALNLLFHSPFLVPALGRFESFFDFGIVVPIVASLAVAIVAGRVSFVQQRKGTSRLESTGVERGALIAVVAGAANLVGIESVSDSDKAGAIPLQMKGTRFAPSDIRIPAGQSAKLVIKNNDFAAHTFTVETLGIDVDFIPGTEKIVELSAVSAGTYPFVCTIDGHEDMVGFILVQ